MASCLERGQSSDFIEHMVPHIRQQYNWDCGVSCLAMLLSEEQRNEMFQNFIKICQEEGFAQSTWTIDLCYLLKRFNIKHCMYTTLVGVNDTYKNINYYRDILTMDSARVQQRFDKALTNGIFVREASLSLQELLLHLTNHGPAIVLVDGGLMTCDLCKYNKLKAEFRRSFGGSYRGHYVLVVGYSARTCKLLYRDPALTDRLCALSYRRFDAARTARGTDQDVILIYNNFTQSEFNVQKLL